MGRVGDHGTVLKDAGTCRQPSDPMWPQRFRQHTMKHATLYHDALHCMACRLCGVQHFAVSDAPAERASGRLAASCGGGTRGQHHAGCRLYSSGDRLCDEDSCQRAKPSSRRRAGVWQYYVNASAGRMLGNSQSRSPEWRGCDFTLRSSRIDSCLYSSGR